MKNRKLEKLVFFNVKGSRQEKDAFPFFLIVEAVMIFLYGITLYIRPELRKMPAIAVFSLLMLIHCILHWFFPLAARTGRSSAAYLAVQYLLASAVILYTREASLVYGLLLALLGEGAGAYWGSRKPLLIAAATSALVIVLLGYTGAGLDFLTVLVIIPWVFFILVYVHLYSRQAEARARAETLVAELESARRHLAEYAVRVEDLTLITERRRMAREIHDTLAQGLTGIILKLEAAQIHLERGDTARVGDILADAAEKSRGTLKEARMVIDDLRTIIPEPVNLSSMLKEDLRRILEPAEISLDLKLDYTAEPEGDALVHLRRIVAETAVNTVRHSGSRVFTAGFSEEKGEYRLCLEDRGKGFDPGNIAEGHWGIIGMEERARLLGGRLTVESSPGNGCRVIVKFPSGHGAGGSYV